MAEPKPGPDDLLGKAVLLRYVDAQGEESRRRISIYDVRQEGHALYLNAYCFERRAPRCFRVDRIQDMADPKTGELMTGMEIRDHLLRLLDPAGLSPHAYTARLLREEAPALRVLLFLARADGHFHADERSAALQYLDYVSAKADWRVEDGEALLDSLYPEHRVFLTAARQLRRFPQKRRHLVRSVRNVIEADGDIDAREHVAVAELLSLIGRVEA